MVGQQHLKRFRCGNLISYVYKFVTALLVGVSIWLTYLNLALKYRECDYTKTIAIKTQ